MKRPLVWLAALLWALGLAAAAQPALSSEVAAAYLVKADDRVLWEKDADKRLPPASLTKIMTGLLALEHYRPQEIVTVGGEAADETGSRLGLRRGDRMSVENLLAATLIKSANDACHVLADHVAGDEAHFVELMNARAHAWGLRDTHFVNACGHDDPAHYSSAHDLALLAERALADPVFAALVPVARMTVATADGRRHFRLKTHNALIGRYPGVEGVKTGYTPNAGKCLVALVRREGREVLLVLLNAPNRWWDAVELLDRAFAEMPGAA